MHMVLIDSITSSYVYSGCTTGLTGELEETAVELTQTPVSDGILPTDDMMLCCSVLLFL